MNRIIIAFFCMGLAVSGSFAATPLSTTRLDTVIVPIEQLVMTAKTGSGADVTRTYSGKVRYQMYCGYNDSLEIGLSFAPVGGGATVEVQSVSGDVGTKTIMTGWNGPKQMDFTCRIVGNLAPQYLATVTVEGWRGAVEKKVEQLLAQMTLAEKVAQLHGDDHKSTADLTRLNINGFKMEDGPFGCQAGQNILYPASIAQAQAWDTLLSRRIGEAMGKEFRGRSKNVQLGPTINMCRHPVAGRNFESYGEDPYLTARIGVATIKGIQSAGTIASVKHFVANDRENNRHTYSSNLSERTLREIYAYPFEYVVKEAGVMSIMSSYNRINETYASENAALLIDLLKNEWGFRGFEVSDWGGTKTTVKSANAGHDVEMPYSEFYGSLGSAVSSGEVSMETLDDKVRRVLRTKIWSETLEGSILKYPEAVNSQAHKQLALECAQKSIVLAKNDNSILPLSKNIGKVTLLGPCVDWVRGGGGGSSTVTPLHMVTPLEGITAKIGAAKITTDLGSAASADAVIVFVVTATDGEFGDRCGDNVLSAANCDSGLRERTGGADQNALVKQAMAANPKTIVVFMGGSPVVPEEWADAPGIVLAYYPGQEQGFALADILFGDVNPSGKIVQTFPASANQVLPDKYFHFYNDIIEYEPPQIGIGYRWYDYNNFTPKWPFGHGLSYTTYGYADLSARQIQDTRPDAVVEVTATITNTGNRAGEEVAQLYITQEGATHRPSKELKGFCRVNLDPGQSKTVQFVLGERDFSYWNETEKRWVIDGGDYRIRVGASAGNLPLETVVTMGKR